MSEPEKDVLSKRIIDELTDKCLTQMKRDGFHLLGQANSCEVRPASYIQSALEHGVFYEKDGRIWNRLGYEVIELKHLPEPPQELSAQARARLLEGRPEEETMKPTKKQRRTEALAQYSEELAARLLLPDCPEASRDRRHNRQVDQRKRQQRRDEIAKGLR